MAELFPVHELLASIQLQLWKTWKTQSAFDRILLMQWGVLPSDIGRVCIPKNPFPILFGFLDVMGGSFFFYFLQTFGRDVLCLHVFASGHSNPFWRMFGVPEGLLWLASAFVRPEGCQSGKVRLKELCLLLLGDTPFLLTCLWKGPGSRSFSANADPQMYLTAVSSSCGALRLAVGVLRAWEQQLLARASGCTEAKGTVSHKP